MLASIIRGTLDRALLVASIIAAGCVPSFIAQYRQRIGGRLDQALADLAPFQQIAQREFGGDLAALVRHHAASSDPTFQKEGAAVQQMIDAAARLRDAVHGLDTNLFGQAAWLATHPDPEVARATWAAWQPAFALNVDGLLFALLTALVLWAVFLLAWHGFSALLSRPQPRSVRSEPFIGRGMPPRGARRRPSHRGMD